MSNKKRNKYLNVLIISSIVAFIILFVVFLVSALVPQCKEIVFLKIPWGIWIVMTIFYLLFLQLTKLLNIKSALSLLREKIKRQKITTGK